MIFCVMKPIYEKDVFIVLLYSNVILFFLFFFDDDCGEIGVD